MLRVVYFHSLTSKLYLYVNKKENCYGSLKFNDLYVKTCLLTFEYRSYMRCQATWYNLRIPLILNFELFDFFFGEELFDFT